MYYPFFEVPKLGGGMVLAAVAIVHVFIAHFAVGAGLFNAVTETLAVRRNDQVLLRFLRVNTRFLILYSFVAGAVTGVGIWFTCALVGPRTISLLIHNFVWGWAIEWVFFAVEIAAGYVYYYTWDTLSPRRHVIVGWIYAVAAWASLFIINGILTFMLSPGEGLTAGGPAGRPVFHFWAAFFNPTHWPSVWLRTVSALSLAAIFACVVVNLKGRWTREDRTRVINHASWFLVPLALMAPLALWYFHGVPEDSRSLVFGGAVAMMLFLIFGVVTSVLIAFYAYWGLIRRRRYANLETSILLAATAFVATGSMEFVREGIRKPWLVHGYIYANELTPAEVAGFNREGMFARDENGALRYGLWISAEVDPATISPVELGAVVYRVQCAQCHVPGGFNAIAPMMRGWSPQWTAKVIRNLHEHKHFMPPFGGNDAELNALVAYLHALRDAEKEDRSAGPAARKEAEHDAADPAAG